MHKLAALLLAFGFAPGAYGFDDLIELASGAPAPQSDREAVFEMLSPARWSCVRPVEEAGFRLFSQIEITPLKLPHGIDRFRLMISVCDSDQKCHRSYYTEFPASLLNSLVSQVWIIEYGCKVKAPHVVAGIQVELIADLPWHQRDQSIDVGYVLARDLIQKPQTVKTLAGKAEFKIEAR